MEIFLTYLKVFAVGGLICLIGQIFINKTEVTSARILVGFMLLGVIFEVTGAFTYMESFAKAGVTIPIMGFGSNLAKGALKGAAENGLIGAITGGMTAVAAGLTAAIVFGFIFALLFKSKTKKL